MTNIGTKYILANKFLFDPYSNSLTDQSTESDVVRLGSNESRILLILIENMNNIVTRDQLHEYVWREQGFQVDDSSLTQAISTLRKMLQDSTKSPQFIKTVPKRGYQLIAQVEVAPTGSSSPLKTESNEDSSVETDIPSLDVEIQTEQVKEQPSTEPKANAVKQKQPFSAKLIWLLVVLLPLLAWALNPPKTSNLVQLTVIENLPVYTTKTQLDIAQWVPTIKRCTDMYLSQRPDKSELTEIIVTGSEQERLTLNFVNKLDLTSENKTVFLFVDQSNIDSLCQ